MKLKITLIGFLIGMVLLTQTACSKQAEGNEEVANDGGMNTYDTAEVDATTTLGTLEETSLLETEDEATDTSVMEEFNELTSGDEVKLTDVISFLQNNLASVSVENATTMLLRFEELHVHERTELEKKYNQESIQLSFLDAYLEGIDFSQIDDVKEEALHELLQVSKDSGFKLEQAEGFFYPVIDYSIYLQFVPHVNPDINEYFNVMAVESEQVFAKDAALLIGWEEVIDRALAQEAFLTNYPESARAAAIMNLYQKYERIAVFGLDNTPLFDYHSNVLKEEAKRIYEDFLSGELNSKFLTKLKDFMEIVKENNDQLSTEVEQYRNNMFANQVTLTDTDKEENRYFVAGIDNALEFEKSFHFLQKLVKDGDKNEFAEYVAYPITVTIDGVRTEIVDEIEFVENYDSIMTDAVKEALLNQKVEETFVNYKGVMVGQGEIWINNLAGTKHIYSIYGINN